jgi:WD40 repeat protein
MAEPTKGSLGALLQRYPRSWKKRGDSIRQALASSPCGRCLYVAEGEAVHRLPLPLPVQHSATTTTTTTTSWWAVFGREEDVRALAASPDGRFLFAAGCADTKLTAASCESMTGVGGAVALPCFLPPTLVLAVSPDSSTLYCCTDAALFLLDTPSGGARLKLRRTVALPKGGAVGFSLSPAGDRLALAVAGSERVHVWAADSCSPAEPSADVTQGDVSALAWVGPKRLVAASSLATSGRACLWEWSDRAGHQPGWVNLACEEGVPCDAIAVAPYSSGPSDSASYGDAVLLFGRGGAASLWHTPASGFLLGLPFAAPVKLPPVYCPNMCAAAVVGGKQPAAILTEGHCEVRALVVRCAALRPMSEDQEPGYGEFLSDDEFDQTKEGRRKEKEARKRAKSERC